MIRFPQGSLIPASSANRTLNSPPSHSCSAVSATAGTCIAGESKSWTSGLALASEGNHGNATRKRQVNHLYSTDLSARAYQPLSNRVNRRHITAVP